MSRRCLIAVLAILSVPLVVGPVWAGSNTWTASGPAGGPIRAVLVEDPSSPTTVYAGTLGGGVFKTTDGGDTWVPSGLDGLKIRALVRDPTPPATIYAGVENDAAALSGGVFSTQDGGANWTPLDLGLTNKKVQALALDGSTLYAGTAGGGVFKLDSGTWNPVNAAGFVSPNCSACPFKILSLATDSRFPGTVYAGTEGAGVYKTTDGGASWIRYPNPPVQSPFNQGWRSDCLEDAEVQALLVDETQPTETLYAGAKGKVGNTGCNQSVGGSGVPGQGPGFFRFLDSGDRLWDRRMNGMYGTDLPATFTLNVYAIARVGGRIYVGTDFGVFTTTDQAGSWDGVPRMHSPPASSNLVGLPIRALAASLSGGTTTLYAGSVGRGMFKREIIGTVIGDGPWIEQNSGLTALRAKSVAVMPVAAQPGLSRVLAGLSSGGVIKSDDGGITWQNTTETPSPSHYPVIARTVNGIAVDPSDLTTVYGATGRGVIKSTNRGDTWTSASIGLPTKLDPPVHCPGGTCSDQVTLGNFTVPLEVKSIAADPANPGVLYAAVAGVYTSVDEGATWVALNGNLPSNVTSGDGAVSVIIVDPRAGDPIWGTIYAGTNGFGMYKSINGGTSWTQVNAGIAVADQSIAALALEPLPDPGTQTLHAGTSTGRVYRTDNGGQTWGLGNLPRGLPGNSIAALTIPMADPRVIYAALNGAGVYTSADGAASWQAFDNTGISLDVASLAVDATQSPLTLYAATAGHGMYDFQIVPASTPDIILQSPLGPYPFESSASHIDVTATGLNTTKMFWSTNRGHAGQATLAGASAWTASSVTLEPGLNLVTLTAVNASSNETSASITVNLLDPEPVIFVDPTSVAFGTVPVGGTSSLQQVTVRNDGTADLILGALALGGANPGQFKKAADKDLCSGVTLAPAQTCTVGLRFKPTSSGAQNATLTIPSNDPVTSLVTVILSGTGSGGGPVIFVNPLSVPFGTVSVGGVSALQQVTVRNDGTADLILGTLALGGANPDEFKKGAPQDLCSGVTLLPTQTCTVGLKFKPTNGGARSATLTIPSNDPVTSLVTVTLGGTGEGPENTVSPLSLSFGALAVGSPSALQHVTVRNDGTVSLILGTIALGGANPGDFKQPVDKDLCSGASLAPTQQCTVGLRFKPTSVGPKNATLEIPSNDFNEPSVTVTLSGTGQ